MREINDCKLYILSNFSFPLWIILASFLFLKHRGSVWMMGIRILLWTIWTFWLGSCWLLEVKLYWNCSILILIIRGKVKCETSWYDLQVEAAKWSKRKATLNFGILSATQLCVLWPTVNTLRNEVGCNTLLIPRCAVYRRHVKTTNCADKFTLTEAKKFLHFYVSCYSAFHERYRPKQSWWGFQYHSITMSSSIAKDR